MAAPVESVVLALILVLDLPGGLVGANIAARVRIVLKCQWEWTGSGGKQSAKPIKLRDCHPPLGFPGGREMGRKWHAVAVLAITYIVTTTAVAANDKGLSFAGTAAAAPEEASSLGKLASLDGTTHQHVWPPLNAGWRTVLGSFVGFFGAALGSIGGLGGGAIFVPMLTLIVGFDTKSATAMSKCMITGAAISTVYCNLKLKHPTFNMPMIDYDLALLIQPMLMMGVSIWKNIYWKEFGLLIFVWAAILTLQVAMNYVETCSTLYWVFSLLQIPVSAGVSIYQAVGLVQGKRVISSRANTQTSLKSHLVLICFFGVTAGVLGGLLGIGGGVIMGPLFLELGIPPQLVEMQLNGAFDKDAVDKGVVDSDEHGKDTDVVDNDVSSATATFAMMFSSSIAVIEYYLLNRFPIPYGILFFFFCDPPKLVARKLINWLGRASFIIFVLSFMIFIGVIPLGGVGILNMKHKMVQHEYMGFHDICMSDA
uniref:Uncharacterized protein n=1 Tax=Aegilops tauschii TaxID=37682 RepID=N1QZF4_AEGTA